MRGVGKGVRRIELLAHLRDALLGLRGAGGSDGFQRAGGVGDQLGPVAEQDEIVAGLDRARDRFGEAVVADDGAHVEVVADDDAVVAPLVAQEALDDFLGKRGGKAAVVELGIVGVADHHGIELGREGAEGFPLGFLELRASAGDDGQLVMRIDRGVGVAGEMLAATEHALLAQGCG